VLEISIVGSSEEFTTESLTLQGGERERLQSSTPSTARKGPWGATLKHEGFKKRPLARTQFPRALNS